MMNPSYMARGLYTMVLCALLAIAGQSCKSKAQLSEKDASSAEAVDTAAVDSALAEAVVVPRDSLVLSLNRTPCFGQCPTYKVKVYESGYATYEGLNFVDRMGMYEVQLPAKEVDAIRQAALDGGFFGFEERYDLTGLQDLPDNILMINDGERSHRVNARFEVPRRVQQFFTAMIERLDGYNWQASKEVPD